MHDLQHPAQNTGLSPGQTAQPAISMRREWRVEQRRQPANVRRAQETAQRHCYTLEPHSDIRT